MFWEWELGRDLAFHFSCVGHVTEWKLKKPSRFLFLHSRELIPTLPPQCPMISVSPSPPNTIFGPQSSITQHCSSISPCISLLAFLWLLWHDLCLIYPEAVSSAYNCFFSFLLTNTPCVYDEIMHPSVQQFYSWLLCLCLLLCFNTYIDYSLCARNHTQCLIHGCALSLRMMGLGNMEYLSLNKYLCMKDSRDLGTG